MRCQIVCAGIVLKAKIKLVFFSHRQPPFCSSSTRCQCYKTFLSVNTRIFVQSYSVCQNRLEKLVSKTNTLAYDNNSYSYGQKKFCNIGPRCQCHKLLSSLSLMLWQNKLKHFVSIKKLSEWLSRLHKFLGAYQYSQEL